MGGQDLQVVGTKLTKKELLSIYGGVSLTATIINAFSNSFKTVYGFGQDFGGAVKRIITGNTCKL